MYFAHLDVHPGSGNLVISLEIGDIHSESGFRLINLFRNRTDQSHNKLSHCLTCRSEIKWYGHYALIPLTDSGFLRRSLNLSMAGISPCQWKNHFSTARSCACVLKPEFHGSHHSGALWRELHPTNSEKPINLLYLAGISVQALR